MAMHGTGAAQALRGPTLAPTQLSRTMRGAPRGGGAAGKLHASSWLGRTPVAHCSMGGTGPAPQMAKHAALACAAAPLPPERSTRPPPLPPPSTSIIYYPLRTRS